MAAHRWSHARSAGALAILTSLGACSLINSYDDVVPQKAGNGGSGGSGATSAQGGSPDNEGGAGNTSGTTSTAAGAAQGGEGGAGVLNPGQDPGPGPNPTTDLLVLASQDAQKNRYVSAVNGRTGKELAIETIPVAALAYDEAPNRHLWFVFTASEFPARPTGTADLEVRHFDDATGKWFVVGRATALPPPEPDQLVVLNGRLAYLSHRVVSGKAVPSLTVLDISEPRKVMELESRNAAAGESYVGLVGDRGSEVNAAAPGGRLRLMIASDCTADCALSGLQLTVADSLTEGTSASLGRFVGVPRFVKARTEDKLYAAFRNSQGMQVHAYSGADLSAPTIVAQPSTFVGDEVGGLILSECDGVGAVTDVMGKQLFGFNLVSGMSQGVDLMYPGAQLYFGAFSSTVVSLDPTAAPGLHGFDVSKSGTSNVAVNALSIWKPTGKFAPLTAVARHAESYKCP